MCWGRGGGGSPSLRGKTVSSPHFPTLVWTGYFDSHCRTRIDNTKVTDHVANDEVICTKFLEIIEVARSTTQGGNVTGTLDRQGKR